MSRIETTSRDLQPVHFTFRVGITADIDAMALTMERANAGRDGRPLPEVITDEYRLEEVHRRMGYEDSWTYLAESGRKLAGFVLGHSSDTEDTIETREQDEYLALLMAEPDTWGTGVSSVLVDMAYDHARALGRERMLLGPGGHNNALSRRFYKKGVFVRNVLDRALLPLPVQKIIRSLPKALA